MKLSNSTLRKMAYVFRQPGDSQYTALLRVMTPQNSSVAKINAVKALLAKSA